MQTWCHKSPLAKFSQIQLNNHQAHVERPALKEESSHVPL